MKCMFVGADGDRRIESRTVQGRHFLIELFRETNTSTDQVAPELGSRRNIANDGEL